jgi:hypothetical protein
MFSDVSATRESGPIVCFCREMSRGDKQLPFSCHRDDNDTRWCVIFAASLHQRTSSRPHPDIVTRFEGVNLMVVLIQVNHMDFDREVTLTKGVMSPL